MWESECNRFRAIRRELCDFQPFHMSREFLMSRWQFTFDFWSTQKEQSWSFFHPFIHLFSATYPCLHLSASRLSKVAQTWPDPVNSNFSFLNVNPNPNVNRSWCYTFWNHRGYAFTKWCFVDSSVCPNFLPKLTFPPYKHHLTSSFGPIMNTTAARGLYHFTVGKCCFGTQWSEMMLFLVLGGQSQICTSQHRRWLSPLYMCGCQMMQHDATSVLHS